MANGQKGLAVFALCAAVCSAGIAVVPTCSNVRVGRISGSSDMGVFFDLDMDAIVTVSLQTNGVAVSPDRYPSLGGRYVAAGANRRLAWPAHRDWPDQKLEKVKALVTAWSPDVPPPYMVVNLTNQSDVAYYDSAGAVPFGVSNRMYKTTHLVMAKIPAAGRTWRVGSLPGDASTVNREMLHYVAFSDDYYMGIYEFTGGQWLQFNSTNPSTMHPQIDRDVCPVETVNWAEVCGGGLADAPAATSLLGLLRARTGLAFDLPRHAQWEVACRAGCAGNSNVPGATQSQVAWMGNNRTDDPKYTDGTYDASKYYTHEVGLKLPNAFGLYDTIGNVLEMGRDCLLTTRESRATNIAAMGLTEGTLLTVVSVDLEQNATSVTVGDTTATGSASGSSGRWGGACDSWETGNSVNPSRWAGAGGSKQCDTGFRVYCPAKNGGRLAN